MKKKAKVVERRCQCGKISRFHADTDFYFCFKCESYYDRRGSRWYRRKSKLGVARLMRIWQGMRC